MQHSGKANIGGPDFFRGDFGDDDGIRHGLADEFVFADGLHRRIAIDGQAKDAGEVTADRNGELQLLILNEVAVRDAFPAAGDDAVITGELVFGYAEALGCKIEQRLVSVSGSFADIWRATAQEIEGAAAVRRAVGVSRDDRGNCVEGNAKLVGHDLAIGSESGALAEITLAGANQDSAVRVNLDPGVGERGIEGVLERRASDWVRRQELRADERDADDECAASFYELAAGKSCAANTRCVGGGCHGYCPFPMRDAAC